MIKGSGHPPIDKVCKYCQKNFVVRYKFRDQKCCSLKCTSLYGWSLKDHRKTFEKPCEICKKPMLTRPSRQKSGRGKYCSKKCYSIAMSEIKKGIKLSNETRQKIIVSKIGKNNPMYIHGQSFNAKKYQGQFNSLIHEKILIRDNYQCKKCGSNNKLHIHHIDLNPLNNSLNNLITWCNSCHITYHREYEYSHNLR